MAGNARGGWEQCVAYRGCPAIGTGRTCAGRFRAGRGVSWYGPTPSEVKLLDGVLLAAKAATLLDGGVRFDPQFAFHFYDIDFCRTAARAGLRLGTWPIAVTHASGGRFGSPEWQAAAEAYFASGPGGGP